MTNLKKTLAVVLAFAMILSMGAVSTFAFEDVAEGTVVSEAVGILSNLGIIEGFEDGTFRPTETVTRAQMAAIICRALGYEEQATSSAGSTIFDDVAADHWAAGYINVAQSLGIINGYGDGNYGPEDQVTYEQAVKMIVVALGYELDAQSKGGWSTGYLAVASREGITKNANGVVGSPAARSTIAVLVYNSLEVRLMDQESWSTGGQDDAYGKTDDTILSKYLEVQKWEGVVATTPFSDYAQNGYEADADAFMTLSTDGDGAFYTEYVEGKLTKQYDNPGEVDASLVADVNTLAGKKVIAYIGAEEDDVTGNKMVYAIAEKQGANKVTKLSGTQLVEDGDKYWDEADVIGYRNVGSTRINSVDLDTNVTVSINYGTASASVSTTEDLASLLAGGGTAELISNDNNAKIDVILVTTYAEEAVVEAVVAEEEMLTFQEYTGEVPDYDTEDEDSLIVVVKDGAVATVADIAANDTVSIVDLSDDSFQVYYVSSKTVTGAVGSYDNDVVEIAGEEYEISPLSQTVNQPSDLSGKEGIFFLNVDGQISHEEAEASKGNYAVVLAVGATSGITSGYEVEVVLADGSIKTYALGSKAYIEDVQETKDEQLTAEKLDDVMVADGEAKRVTAENILSSVYEITVKNDQITKLVKLASGTSSNGKEYDAENMLYGAISFSEATVIVSVDAEGTAKVESDDIVVGTVADFMADGEGEDYALTAFDEDNNDVAGLVVGFGLAATIPQDGAAIVITAVKTTTVNDNDAYQITGFQAGKEVTYTICDEEEDYTGDVEDLAKGNVILVGVANAENVVSDFEVLYKKDGTVVAADDDVDEIYNVAGAVSEVEGYEPTSNKFFIDNAANDGQSAVYYVAEDGVVMRASANYTLVDYSESSTNPEVSKKTRGTGLFTIGKYDSKVFIRYYEDSLVEVIVYRYNNAPVVEDDTTPAE